MMNRPTFSDVYDINPKTGALILGKNRLDDYATKFLNKYCKKALDTPMPLPVNEILKTMKLTVMEASLSRNMDIFGCCLLLDSEVEVFDREEGTSSLVFYPAGTVLLDPASEEMYGEGAKRNTLIHEALHWEKDKTYFEILKVKNALVAEKLYPIMCRHTETFYEPPEGKKTKENEVRWLEWQAHRLAPRILMPVKMFRKKALDLLEVYREPQNDIYPSCDRLIEDLSDFFIVSRSSVKYRLTEVGLIDEICKLEDYDAVFADIHESKEFVALTPVEAYQLLESSSLLQDWVQGGRFVFADGYFVLADAKYIVAKTDGLHLTAKAKKSLQQCVINIREKNYIVYQNFNKDLTGCAFISDDDEKWLMFNAKFSSADEVYESIYRQAKSSIYVVDNYIGLRTLVHLKNSPTGVNIILFSDNVGNNKLHNIEYTDFRKEYPTVKLSMKKTGGIFHDRFIVLDYGTADERVFLCGASSKDAGARITSIVEDYGIAKYNSVIAGLLKNSPLVLPK